MLYFGQEVGERGMREEGFSGLDGRTSIFDWWTPEKLSRLYRFIHGEDAALSAEEKALLGKYRDILKFAMEDEAVRRGCTYDLCYCNFSSDGFDHDRHFAFLRDFGDETLLVVCNFSRAEASMKISIPEHAFGWLELPETESVNHSTPIPVTVPPKDGVVIRLA